MSEILNSKGLLTQVVSKAESSDGRDVLGAVWDVTPAKLAIAPAGIVNRLFCQRIRFT